MPRKFGNDAGFPLVDSGKSRPHGFSVFLDQDDIWQYGTYSTAGSHSFQMWGACGVVYANTAQFVVVLITI